MQCSPVNGRQEDEDVVDQRQSCYGALSKNLIAAYLAQDRMGGDGYRNRTGGETDAPIVPRQKVVDQESRTPRNEMGCQKLTSITNIDYRN